jgi:crotonobetainyl-CoA:carnitine CoA-transferase CaiB-like acyl-CoA transferase
MSDDGNERKGPLHGIRVLDFTAMIAGPYCTRALADMGADVVKVEPPEGDYMRGREPLRQDAEGNRHSAYYGTLNCGKRSIALDLKRPDGKQLALELAQKADVVVENFRPGVMRRLGLDYDALAAINPSLVYCSISGYGQAGESAGRPAYAPIIHAACGYELATLNYQDGIDEPLQSGIFIADVLSGSIAFGAINAALVRRERSSQGEYVDVTLMDAMLGLLVYECQEAQFPAQRRRPVYRPINAQGGFLIVAPISAANFADMARAMKHPEWIADARFSGTTAREQNWEALMDLIQDWARERSVDECEKILLENGVPCARYRTVAEAMASDAIKDRGTFATVRDGAGDFLVPNPGFKLRSTEVRACGSVDKLGGSGAAVVASWLGRTAARILED